MIVVFFPVIATCNDIRISNPIKSRFIVLEFEQYTYEQFFEIAINLLTKRYSITEPLSATIADEVWNSRSRDVKDLLKVGKIPRSAEVVWLVNLVRKYNVKNEL